MTTSEDGASCAADPASRIPTKTSLRKATRSAASPFTGRDLRADADCTIERVGERVDERERERESWAERERYRQREESLIGQVLDERAAVPRPLTAWCSEQYSPLLQCAAHG